MTYNYMSQADFIWLALNLCKWFALILIPLAVFEYVYEKHNKEIILYKGKSILQLLEYADNQLAVYGEIDFSKIKQDTR
ncbi:MAG: hypothetical protein Tp156SUR915002_22 [Prokaryotic dsDNA virus sp.]|jgi:cbb3-type cytochrome oxidase subunit 3|nr:MAG: hypothetical protein Tp162SUR384061_31 [Prokaryotic dsDNA virus sp.]QDP59761.1 MAG: hypothetical protein Tp156SUR915002_22 [Prokaryotic dsDNA virus sp.]|tara:strand:+ start:19440 stop:19676 length:237 start_codon:yes stop_codon:yes gene_type:complete